MPLTLLLTTLLVSLSLYGRGHAAPAAPMAYAMNAGGPPHQSAYQETGYDDPQDKVALENTGYQIHQRNPTWNFLGDSHPMFGMTDENDFPFFDKRGSSRSFLRFGRNPNKSFLRFGRSIEKQVNNDPSLEVPSSTMFASEDTEKVEDPQEKGGRHTRSAPSYAASMLYREPNNYPFDHKDISEQSNLDNPDLKQVEKKAFQRSFLRFGRDPMDLHFLRFGKRGNAAPSDLDNLEEFIRANRSRMGKSFLRFG